MKKIKLFETWLTEDEAAAKGCTITIASCSGKGGNVVPKAKSFTVDSVSGDAKANGAPLKAGSTVGISTPVTMTGTATVKLSAADEDITLSCDGKTAKCVIAGKE